MKTTKTDKTTKRLTDDNAGPTRKLVLARETLRTLTSDELRLVAGGQRSKTIDCPV